MPVDGAPVEPSLGAMAPLETGPLIAVAKGSLMVTIAPAAGGRIAQICRDGIDHLVSHGGGNEAMIAWGSYPMVPWAGRIREGRFAFRGTRYQLPLNLGEHAIHGVGFALPWHVDLHAPDLVELSLQLPDDERWPFGGTAWQRIQAGERWVRMALSVRAGEVPMPAVIGWHPWFRKPDRIQFDPSRMYPRDSAGITTLPLVEPTPSPWDDCFINHAPVTLERGGQRLQLSSDCTHWVVYDDVAHATCVEPQSGPPDAFNIEPLVLMPGEVLERHFIIEWM